MSLIKRLFASDSDPWCRENEKVEIDISGSKLKFTCPGHYSWSKKRCIQPSYVDRTEGLESLSRDQFRLSRDEFRGKLIFYREWSHWGKIIRPRYIAVSSMCVWLIHVPKEREEDSLNRFDYLRKKFPLFLGSFESNGPDLNQGEKISRIGSGYLGMSGQKQRPSFDRACIKSASGRETYDYSIYSLSCEYALVFEVYQVQSPESSDFLMNSLTDKSGEIIDSFWLDMNQEDLSEKDRVLRKFAEELGSRYDEVDGVIW